MATNPNQEIDRKIKEYISLREEARTLKPKVNKLLDELKVQMIPFKIHEVIASAMETQFGDTDSIVAQLEEKVDFETKVYEKLKMVVLSLTVDQDKLQILETGSFTDSRDLVEIEKQLSIVSEFSRGEIELDIMKEREAEVMEMISNFMKRFLIFISKLQLATASTGELRMHREFYEIMNKYKFIYKFAESNKEYHSTICLAYVRKSRKLYDHEFKTHLNILTDLVKNVDSLKHAMIILIKSYESLLSAENVFMSGMGIKCDTSDIFAGVDSMIMDFLGIFFKRYPYYILYAVSVYSFQQNGEKLGSLAQMLNNELPGLQELFIHQQRGVEANFETVELINGLYEISDDNKLAGKLITDLREKVKKMDISVETQIKNLQIIRGVKRATEEISGSISECEKSLVEKIIGKVFGSKDEAGEVKTLFRALVPEKLGYTEASAFLKQTILENCDKSKQGIFTKIISDVSR